MAGFPRDIQKTIQAIRDYITAEAPEATEKIAYGMPSWYLSGHLVYFAAFKDHYSLFPGPAVIERFTEELAPYRTGKGTLRFPLDMPLPWDILKKVIRLRIDENLKKAAMKKEKTRNPRKTRCESEMRTEAGIYRTS
jgi:uncharacterized protein YdhG (YjbR/CyaY superfamily)